MCTKELSTMDHTEEMEDDSDSEPFSYLKSLVKSKSKPTSLVEQTTPKNTGKRSSSSKLPKPPSSWRQNGVVGSKKSTKFLLQEEAESDHSSVSSLSDDSPSLSPLPPGTTPNSSSNVNLKQKKKTPTSKSSTPKSQLSASSTTAHNINGRDPARIHRDTTGDNDNNTAILLTISSTLQELVGHMKEQKDLILSMNNRSACSATSSGSSAPGKSSKKKISNLIRSEVRSIYHSLCEEDQTFEGYSTELGKSFKDPLNKPVTERLVCEVKSCNPGFQTAEIRAAAYTYYRTLCQDASLERRGVKEKCDQYRRRRERLTRKLNTRKTVLELSDLSSKEKEKWMSVMSLEFMSSEVSSDSDSQDQLLTLHLPWRSEKVSSFFRKLDELHDERKSPLAKRQSKKRVYTEVIESERAPPDKKEYPKWGFVNEQQ